MRLLILTYNYKGYMYEGALHMQNALTEVIPDTVLYGPGFAYNNNRLPAIIKEVYGSGSPDAIALYQIGRNLHGGPIGQKFVDHFHIPPALKRFPLDVEKVKVAKVLLASDIWQWDRAGWREMALTLKINALFSPVVPPYCDEKLFNKYIGSDVRSRIRIESMLPVVAQDIFRDYGLAKEYDVTLLGRLGESFYPLRTHFDRVLRTQKKIKYFVKDNPPYQFYENDDVGGIPIRGNYARAINRSRIFITCCTKFRTPVAKTFEALACKTLLMCDRPAGAEKVGLVDGETYAEVTRDNFMSRIRYYLSRPDEIRRIAENGYNLFLRRHAARKRVLKVRDSLESMISEQGKRT